MSEQEMPVRPVQIVYVCDECGLGEMQRDGDIALTSYPPQFPHVCVACGHRRNFTVTYPHVRFKRIEDKPRPETTRLDWPEPSPPTKDVSHYDHIKAHGFTIEWKSWKDYPGYTVMKDVVDEGFIGTFDTLDEAKAAVIRAISENKSGSETSTNAP